MTDFSAKNGTADKANYAGTFLTSCITPLPIVQQLPFQFLNNTFALDVGAGNGRHAIYLAKQGIHVDAIDAFSPAIDQLKRYAHHHALPIRGRIHDLRECDPDFRGYGLVLFTLILHLLSPFRSISLLNNARLQAIPGTVHILAAVTRNGDFFRDVLPNTRYYPYALELHDYYSDAGWEILSSYQEIRKMFELRVDGTPAENLVSFVIARRPVLTATSSN
jgi:hypothetical protein